VCARARVPVSGGTTRLHATTITTLTYRLVLGLYYRVVY
jgi:hypothetical protein